MYRILIADDEGLMLEAFKGIILAECGENCVYGHSHAGNQRNPGDEGNTQV